MLFLMTCFNLTIIPDPAFLRFTLSRTSATSSGSHHSQRSAYSCWTYGNLRTQFKTFFLSCFYFKLTPVPAVLTTLCIYVQFLSRPLTLPSIRNYLRGVKLLHLFSGADSPFTKDFIFSPTLRGIARNALHTHRRAPPVSPSLLH